MRFGRVVIPIYSCIFAKKTWLSDYENLKHYYDKLFYEDILISGNSN